MEPTVTHIREDCTALTGTHEREVFAYCTFKNLNGLSLKDCDLSRSAFETDSIKDALGFTLTLQCLSFKRVQFSPLLFDLFLCLVAMSDGNDEKRQKLIDVVGKERYEALTRVMNCTE